MGGIYSEEVRPRLKLAALEIESVVERGLVEEAFFLLLREGVSNRYSD